MGTTEWAVIPAAGRGSRLQRPDPSVILDAATEAIVRQGVKALVPIHGQPFMDYSLRRLIQAGIRQVCFIIAPDSHRLQEYISGLSVRLPAPFPGFRAEWVIQPEARGTAHALRFARKVTGGHDFLMLNSDNLYPLNVLRELAALPLGSCSAVGFDQDTLTYRSNIEASRVSSLGILVPREDQPELLEQVVEKPPDPSIYRRDGKLWVTMNIWRFSPAIYDFCDRVKESARGEFELPSAVQDLSNSGIPVRMLRSSEGVLDLTSRGDIAHLESILPS